jgi:hypothetical protein
VHKYYLGYGQAGTIVLLVTLLGGCLTFGLAWAVMATIALIEFVIYITKTDEEFHNIYVAGRKAWF